MPSKIETNICSSPPTVRRFQNTSLTPPKNFTTLVPAKAARAGTLDLEIGCGVGWHSIQYARQNPDRHLLAIEHGAQRFARFANRLKAHPNIRNISSVHADAVAWATAALSCESISRCFILYPNPNRKNSSKRWFRMPFMHHLLQLIRSNGELILATNEKQYAEEAIEYGTQAWKLRLDAHEKISRSTHPHFLPRTHFELKYFMRDETCHLIRFAKTTV